LQNRDGGKIEEFPSSFTSLFVKVEWREREMVNSSGLECKPCLIHFKGIKGKSGRI